MSGKDKQAKTQVKGILKDWFGWKNVIDLGDILTSQGTEIAKSYNSIELKSHASMKISLYLNDETWTRFKKSVLRRTGDMRSLSSEVQRLLEENTVEDYLRSGFGQMKIDAKPISSSKIVPVKPSVATSSASVIRKIRDGR